MYYYKIEIKVLISLFYTNTKFLSLLNTFCGVYLLLVFKKKIGNWIKHCFYRILTTRFVIKKKIISLNLPIKIIK